MKYIIFTCSTPGHYCFMVVHITHLCLTMSSYKLGFLLFLYSGCEYRYCSHASPLFTFILFLPFAYCEHFFLSSLQLVGIWLRKMILWLRCVTASEEDRYYQTIQFNHALHYNFVRLLFFKLNCKVSQVVCLVFLSRLRFNWAGCTILPKLFCKGKEYNTPLIDFSG